MPDAPTIVLYSKLCRHNLSTFSSELLIMNHFMQIKLKLFMLYNLSTPLFFGKFNPPGFLDSWNYEVKFHMIPKIRV